MEAEVEREAERGRCFFSALNCLTKTVTQLSFPAAAAKSSGLWPVAEQIRALAPCFSSFETALESPAAAALQRASVIFDPISEVSFDEMWFDLDPLCFFWFKNGCGEPAFTNTQQRMNECDTGRKYCNQLINHDRNGGTSG